MGWLIGWRSKEDLVQHLLRQDGGNCDVIDHSLRGNNLWMLCKRKDDGFRFIVLCRLQYCRGSGPYGRDWGYKDIDESMGPFYYDCPERLLAQSDDTSDYGTAWRRNCREMRNRRASRKAFIESLQKGDKFMCLGRVVTFHKMVDHQRWNKPNTRYVTGYVEGDDNLYRWPKSKISPLEAS